jgi:hypothetical protein
MCQASKTLLGTSGGSGKLICVIGARGAAAVRRYRGSVSSQVIAEASCNVTVSRARSANDTELLRR